MRSETKRLILRRFTEDDLADLFDYLSDPIVVEFEPYKPMTLEEVRESLTWRVSSQEMIAVELKSDHKLIGNVYFSNREPTIAEIGFVFNQKYWKQGYAFESCHRVLKDAFAKGIDEITAKCDPMNVNSWRLLEKLGFQRKAHLVKNVSFWKDESGEPIFKDTFVYMITKEMEKIE